MCKCDPRIRTPFCGKPGCEWPKQQAAPVSTCYAFEVASVQWEYEDNLPEMEDVDYAHLFEKSEVRDGVRMFPYVSIYSDTDGTETRHFLGA